MCWRRRGGEVWVGEGRSKGLSTLLYLSKRHCCNGCKPTESSVWQPWKNWMRLFTLTTKTTTCKGMNNRPTNATPTGTQAQMFTQIGAQIHDCILCPHNRYLVKLQRIAESKKRKVAGRQDSTGNESPGIDRNTSST